MNSAKINLLAQEIHADNVAAGWWEKDQCLFTKFQLVSTEVAEATEGERKNLMDDKLPKRKMGEVELADALIRTLDIAGHLKISCSTSYDQLTLPSMPKNINIFKVHWFINKALIAFEEVRSPRSLAVLIKHIMIAGEMMNYDIVAAMEEKRAFNKVREDHKLENRAKANGKKV